MGEILEFPSQQAQGLAYLDRQLREMLTARGADQDLVDFAAGQLTQIYAELAGSEQYSFSVELPASTSEVEILVGLREGQTIIISDLGQFEGAETVLLRD